MQRPTDHSFYYFNRQQAFSLMELLVVLAVIAILTTLAIPAVNSIMRGSQVTHGAQMLVDQLSVARQTALARNRTIEVRFFKYADEYADETTKADASLWRFRSFQLYEIRPTGEVVALGKIQRLPTGLIVEQGLSSLLDAAKRTEMPAGESLAGVGLNYQYMFLRYRPDGSTDLNPTESWYLTVHASGVSGNLSEPPVNFATLQIEPVNGTVRMFRPS